MFPYKSFFERHYILGYSLLTLSVGGVYFIPSFHNWLEDKDKEYSKDFCEYIIAYGSAHELLMDLISAWYNTPQNHFLSLFPNRLKLIEFSEENETFRVNFQTVYFRGFFHRIKYILEWPSHSKVYDDDRISRFSYKICMTKRELSNLLNYYFSMNQMQADIVWEQFCRENRPNSKEEETIFAPNATPVGNVHGRRPAYTIEINQENLQRALARMAQYKAQLGVPPDDEGYIPRSLTS